MTLPTFLIIGAPKCGTTSVYDYLAQHPQVFMSPVKEPRFFDNEGNPDPSTIRRDEAVITGIEAYRALFAKAPPAVRAIGEASPTYLRSENAAAGIKRHIPQARLVAILRQPVDRAYSAYVMARRDGREKAASFEEALASERAGTAADEYFYSARAYHECLQTYYAHFPREQIKVLRYDDLVADAPGFMRTVFDFLGVDPDAPIDTSGRRNAGAVQRSQAIAGLLNRPNPIRYAARRLLPRRLREAGRERLRHVNSAPPPPLDHQLRANLTQDIEADIASLEATSGLDLSAWRVPAA